MYLHVFFSERMCFPETGLHFPLKSAKSLRNGTPVRCTPENKVRLLIFTPQKENIHRYYQMLPCIRRTVGTKNYDQKQKATVHGHARNAKEKEMGKVKTCSKITETRSWKQIKVSGIIYQRWTAREAWLFQPSSSLQGLLNDYIDEAEIEAVALLKATYVKNVHTVLPCPH